MLIRHGYGVLLLDPRGQGSSEGDTVRWAGDRDLLAGLQYLRSRPDVDRDRIGGFGFSIGGEMLLEAAAQSDGFKAIVSEGAGSRVGNEDVSDPARLLAEPNLAVMTAALTVFSTMARRRRSSIASGGSIWRVSGSKHTAGIEARPSEYEQRVIAFFDGALLGDR